MCCCFDYGYASDVDVCVEVDVVCLLCGVLLFPLLVVVVDDLLSCFDVGFCVAGGYGGCGGEVWFARVVCDDEECDYGDGEDWCHGCGVSFGWWCV